jgi:hypothetical protein
MRLGAYAQHRKAVKRRRDGVARDRERG